MIAFIVILLMLAAAFGIFLWADGFFVSAEKAHQTRVELAELEIQQAEREGQIYREAWDRRYGTN